MTSKAQATKEKIDKLDFIKIKSLCIKGYYRKVKKQPTEWEKIFENHISDKSLVSSIYKELLHSTKRQSNFKMGK